jgi:hypothetical protein
MTARPCSNMPAGWALKSSFQSGSILRTGADRLRRGSNLKILSANPCGVRLRKIGIRERLGFATAGDRDAVEYRQEPLPKDARARSRLARAGVGLWSPLLRTVKTMPSTMVPRGCHEFIFARSFGFD